MFKITFFSVVKHIFRPTFDRFCKSQSFNMAKLKILGKIIQTSIIFVFYLG